jgi:hypothetical protein
MKNKLDKPIHSTNRFRIAEEKTGVHSFTTIDFRNEGEKRTPILNTKSWNQGEREHTKEDSIPSAVLP